jgi:hypothetical protein
MYTKTGEFAENGFDLNPPRPGFSAGAVFSLPKEEETMQISKIRKMAECAMMIALGTILSYFIIFSLPMGGTITAFS